MSADHTPAQKGCVGGSGFVRMDSKKNRKVRKCALMKKLYLYLMIPVMAVTLVSCCRNRDEIWDDTKSASRYMRRGLCTLGGKHGDSREVSERSDFYCERQYAASYDDEFVPLADNEEKLLAYSAFTAPQPYHSPGDPGSAIPGIEAFRDPRALPQAGAVFRNIQFPFDSSIVKGKQNLATMTAIAQYMRAHPDLYIFVEGHCDERGPEAYNLALGARRANAIRNTLVKEGAHPDHIFTISYGKERPSAVGHNEAAWAENRRGEFKIYNR